MPNRNTAIFQQILDVLQITDVLALAKLEHHYKDVLLVVAGDINLIASQSETLRLAITTQECGLVLDHLTPHVRVSLDQTEEAINELFPDRFIEP